MSDKTSEEQIVEKLEASSKSFAEFESVYESSLHSDLLRDAAQVIRQQQAEIERLRGLVREARSYINALQNYDVVVGSEYRQMLKWLSAAGEVGE